MHYLMYLRIHTCIHKQSKFIVVTASQHFKTVLYAYEYIFTRRDNLPERREINSLLLSNVQ